MKAIDLMRHVKKIMVGRDMTTSEVTAEVVSRKIDPNAESHRVSQAICRLERHIVDWRMFEFTRGKATVRRYAAVYRLGDGEDKPRPEPLLKDPQPKPPKPKKVSAEKLPAQDPLMAALYGRGQR